MHSGCPALRTTLLAFPHEDRGGNRETYLPVTCSVPFPLSVSLALFLSPSLSPSLSLSLSRFLVLSFSLLFLPRKKRESSDKKEDDKEQENEEERGKTTEPFLIPSSSLYLSPSPREKGGLTIRKRRKMTKVMRMRGEEGTTHCSCSVSFPAPFFLGKKRDA